MAEMSGKAINDLPDSDFAYIEPGGSKDESGRTVPRSLRHFPIHDAAHVRNALARAPQSPFGAKAMPKITAAARKFGIQVAEENSQPPADNLVRSIASDDAARVDGDGRTLFGHFARFNEWTTIDSLREGRFLERLAPGSLADTLVAHRSRIKPLYDHGKDPQLGNKPLGPFKELREDEDGGYYEISLIRASYNDDFIIPAAEAGMLGASFRFSIPGGGDDWTRPLRPTDVNPERLKERTIHKTDVYELGPVTFPAYAGATASIRSGTDDFLATLTTDPLFMARFIERVGPGVVEHILESLPATPQDPDQPPTAPVEHREEQQPDDSADGQPSSPDTSPAARLQMARRIEAERLGVGRKDTP